MNKHLRAAVAFIAACATGLSLAACGSTQSTSGNGDNSKVGGTVTIWTWEQPGKAFSAAAKGFEKKYPSAHIKVENVGNPAIWDKITTGLAAGGQGLPDIMNVGIDYIGGYLDKFPDAFVNLSSYGADSLKKDFPSGMIKSASRNGKLYGIPMEVNTGALIYDVNIFKKAGVDPSKIETWDDYIQAGKTIKAKTGDYLFALNKACTVTDCGNMWQILTALQGSFYFDKSGHITMNDKAGVKAMQMLKEANDAGLVQDLPGTANDTAWQAKQGNIATYFDRSFMPGNLQKTLPEYKNRWRVSALPSVTKGGLRSVVPGGTYLSISNHSSNKKTAWEFIKYALCTEQGQKAMYDSQGLFPGYLPFLRKDLRGGNPYFGGEDVNEVFIKQLEDDTPELNYTSDYTKALKTMTDAQVQVLTQHASPKKVLDAAADRLSQETGRKIA